MHIGKYRIVRGGSCVMARTTDALTSNHTAGKQCIWRDPSEDRAIEDITLTVDLSVDAT
jgi:phage-related protein